MKRITMRMMSGDVMSGDVTDELVESIKRQLKAGTGHSPGVVEFPAADGSFGMFRASSIESLVVKPAPPIPGVAATTRRKSKQK